MGNPKLKWTSEEEEALRAGVAKHGAGKWKIIHRDPEFNSLLSARSNIDLKDKWRNLSVANGQGPRDKSKAPKTEVYRVETPVTPFPVTQISASVVPSHEDASTDVVMLDSSRPLPEGNNASKYNAMIFEALSTLKDQNGADTSVIATFIEQRHEVPQNFKKALGSRLRRLVQQDKLEKVENRYRVKSKAQLDTKSPPTIQKNLQASQVPSIGYLGNTVEEAAQSAAYIIAEAENKAFVAAEAVKEAERVATVAEDMESFLLFATDCFDQSIIRELYFDVLLFKSSSWFTSLVYH